MTDEITEIFDYWCRPATVKPVLEKIEYITEDLLWRLRLVGAEVCREIEEWN